MPKHKKIIIFCGVGLRGYVAYRILKQYGFENIFNLNGGYKTYEYATQKQSNEDIFEGDHIGKDDHIYQVHPGHINNEMYTGAKTIEIDACGLQCPGPIMKLKKSIEEANIGDVLTVSATDQGFQKDVKSWCNMTGHKLVSVTSDKGRIVATIKKNPSGMQSSTASSSASGKTIVVFSDSLDKALASFVIANGAASTGKKVTLFFTFWGLNILKRKEKPSVKKDFLARMFGWFMPSYSKQLALSKLNFAGMGPVLMRYIMKNKGVDSLELMIQMAKENGIQFIACQMSMDVMGVTKEELMDGVEIGGVATYLEEAEQANLNLFI